jgi:UDP-N-acetylenolpyruvoylglucosamine reductase
MLVNFNNAKSSDIIDLATKMQEMVQERFNIIPQPECQLIGFKNNPLK